MEKGSRESTIVKNTINLESSQPKLDPWGHPKQSPLGHPKDALHPTSSHALHPASSLPSVALPARLGGAEFGAGSQMTLEGHGCSTAPRVGPFVSCFAACFDASDSPAGTKARLNELNSNEGDREEFEPFACHNARFEERWCLLQEEKSRKQAEAVLP